MINDAAMQALGSYTKGLLLFLGLGGGNAKKLKRLNGCRLGDNAYAFTGGFRLFEKTQRSKRSA